MTLLSPLSAPPAPLAAIALARIDQGVCLHEADGRLIYANPAAEALSAAQHGIWSGQQFDPRSALYNTGECLELLGALDAALFESCVRRTVREAEALHARFLPGADGPVQHLEPREDWELVRVDVREAADPWAAARDWMREDLARPVDLTQGPLFAQVLFQAGPERFFWYQRIHHVAMDGYGFSLLTRRVAELYTAHGSGRAPGMGFGPLWPVLREDAAYRASAQWELDRAFWLQRLADRPTPASLAPSAPLSSGFVRQTHLLDKAATERLQDAGRRAGLNWTDLVIATTAAFLHQETGARDIVLGLPVMSRLGSAALRVPCMAMNIVPLRLAIRPGQGLFELGREVAAELKRLRPHQRYRYEQLRRDLKIVGGERRLFGPVVNLMPFDQGARFAGLRSLSHNISAGPVEDLSVGVRVLAEGQGLSVDFDANPACYGADVLAAHQRGFLELLERGLTAPEAPLVSPSRREATAHPDALSSGALLDGGPLPVPAHPVLSLLSERTRERPDAVAVEHGPFRLSYAELMRAAGALAQELRERGVRPDTLVAVQVPRSVDAVVAHLGVLLAGAGYLPLDPFGPEARTATLLEDATPGWLIAPATPPEPKAAPVAPGGLAVRRNERLVSTAASAPDTPNAPAAPPIMADST